MSDIFFEADSHNPSNRRYWGKARYQPVYDEVVAEWRSTGQIDGKTRADAEKEACHRLLERSRLPQKEPQP